MHPSEFASYRSALRVVAASYDALGTRYLHWAAQIRGDPRLAWLDDLMSRVPARARVLELGCGAGLPSTQQLAEQFIVTGGRHLPRAASPRTPVCPPGHVRAS